jgi:hypothetical protein
MRLKFARLRMAALLGIACVSANAVAADLTVFHTITLSWEPPTRNTDGSQLTDLLAYYVYVGETPDTMLPLYCLGADSPRLVLRYPVMPGLRFIAVTAVNADGVESERTPNVVKQLLTLE